MKTAEKLFGEVLDLMRSFDYEQNEDRPSNSFFTAELNEDGFFILLHEIEAYVKGAKNTEQQVPPDNPTDCRDLKSKK